MAKQPARERKLVYQTDPLAEPPPAELQAVLDSYRSRRDAVVGLLQEIQALYGYLPPRAAQYATRLLGIPLARIYGVATFYNQFQLTPPGRYVIQVCRGTACHVAGSAALLTELETGLGIHEDETTPDGLFTLKIVACLGCCSLAPVIVVGSDVHGNVTAARSLEALERYRAAVPEASV